MGAILRRYTNVLSLMDILHHKRLTLLSPEKWYDQNDALGLSQHSKRRGDGRVYAICFAEGYEQAHHWQIFSGDMHGVCLQFDKEKLEEHLRALEPKYDIIFGPVKYCNLTEIRNMNPIPDDILPFLKRDTFKAEQEYRVVAWEDSFFGSEPSTLPLPLNLIDRIILGPAMPDALAATLREIAQQQNGCEQLSFTKSRLVNNASWAKAIAEGLQANPPRTDE